VPFDGGPQVQDAEYPGIGRDDRERGVAVVPVVGVRVGTGRRPRAVEEGDDVVEVDLGALACQEQRHAGPAWPVA
jgi:hypothetical protein